MGLTSVGFVPSAPITQMSGYPLSGTRSKATFLPSGEKTGPNKKRAPLIVAAMVRLFVLSASIVWMRTGPANVAERANTSLRPSGDQSGLSGSALGVWVSTLRPLPSGRTVASSLDDAVGAAGTGLGAREGYPATVGPEDGPVIFVAVVFGANPLCLFAPLKLLDPYAGVVLARAGSREGDLAAVGREGGGNVLRRAAGEHFLARAVGVHDPDVVVPLPGYLRAVRRVGGRDVVDGLGRVGQPLLARPVGIDGDNLPGR